MNRNRLILAIKRELDKVEQMPPSIEMSEMTVRRRWRKDDAGHMTPVISIRTKVSGSLYTEMNEHDDLGLNESDKLSPQ